MTSAFATIIYEKVGGVAHISLNRPDRLNAYSVAMRDDFAEALSAADEDPDARALLLTGQGRAFCAGADLTEFGTAPSQAVARRVRWQRDVWGQLIRLSKPIVVAVHGFCIGSGLEITLLADVRIAAKSTVFAMPEVRLGMIPAAGGSQTLPRNAGPSVALEVLLTGRRFTATDAFRYGLVSRVVSDTDFLDAAWESAHQLAQVPGSSFAAMRFALSSGLDLRLKAGLETERRLAATLMDSSAC
jgi:enoyl-CoA hydratase/carnithine racemase